MREDAKTAAGRCNSPMGCASGLVGRGHFWATGNRKYLNKWRCTLVHSKPLRRGEKHTCVLTFRSRFVNLPKTRRGGDLCRYFRLLFLASWLIFSALLCFYFIVALAKISIWVKFESIKLDNVKIRIKNWWLIPYFFWIRQFEQD